MTQYKLDDVSPTLHESAYVANEAVLIGRVQLDASTSVWPCAVLRGDNELIHIAEGSNVQEGAVLHTDPGYPLKVGKNVTIGHQAMLHGCTIEDGALIGIQAVVLNGAVIGRNSLVGAGALVTEGKVFPERSLIIGSPAKAVRTLSDDELAKLHSNASNYQQRAAHFKTNLIKL
ncbi:gamma carbonic anhydrase family protein [Paenalcaligenes niemegkensis]|uniref:gamma carbonic anhydrase family protein n=1 Tax=Paenalcaligenes niemegkensis TaxID=2895469 RepID=UPI001EE917FC|nr:gamma carbonic anhydrase family protein [Paenalcaligenes niemegkensis]MCQ9615599.1 gamma carbonic anhydrase family protein [Paenalcaligenes niemegkensis]